MSGGGDRWTPSFKAAFLLSAAAALVPLWSVKYPPMVDLPQHAASVFVWQHYSEPAYAYRELFAVDVFSPYVFGHGLARLVAELLPILPAMKMVVSLAILALPLAMVHLFRRTGSDLWGALLGFPLAYGFAFYWGFFNFLLAVPMSVVFLARTLDYAREPSRRRGLALAAFAFLVYFCHALAFAFAIPVAGLWILLFTWRGPRPLRTLLVRALPLVPAAVAVAAWVLWQRSVNPSLDVPMLWSEPPWQRALTLPATLTGAGREGGARLLGGLAILLLPWAGGRLAPRSLWLAVPGLTATLYYLAVPNRALNTWFLYPRYAVFTALFALMLFVPAQNPRRARLGHLLVVGFAVAWMAFLTFDFQAMDAEARRFDDLLERMEPNRRVLGLNFDPGYGFVAGMPVFGHFHMWYQAEKGGIAEFTFGVAAPQLVHYRPGKGPFSWPELSRRPQLFDFRRDGDFDYFIVRSPREMGPRLFAGAPVALELRSGDWWLYRRHPSATGAPP